MSLRCWALCWFCMDLGSTNNLLQVRLGADIGEVYNELTKQRLGLQPGDFPME